MLENVRSELAAAIAAELSDLGVADAAVSLDVPPRRQLGDLAWAGALPLAKALRRPPRVIAEAVASRLGVRISTAAPDHPLAFVEPEVAVEGPGFVNFRLRRGPALAALLRPPTRRGEGGRGHDRLARDGEGVAGAETSEPGFTPGERGGRGGASAAEALGGGPQRSPKVVVEHTNINPNKAAHIGHLRNAVLGDVLVRCLRRLGRRVEVQNYVDDTGVQVADVVVGFLFLPEARLLEAVAPFWPEVAEGEESVQVRALRALASRDGAGTLVAAELGAGDFDDLCWELYPRVTRWYDELPEATAHRAEVLHALEGGFPAGFTLDAAVQRLASPDPRPRTPDPEALARLAAAIAEANLRCHLITMGRLAVAYDVLPHESDILHRGFWARAFELLKEADAIRLESEGKNSGCWVMSLAESAEFAGMADADKILLRSNGTVTYTGKDIAYQLWKLGLLRDADGALHDFGYREFARFAAPGPAAAVTYGAGDRALVRTTDDRDDRLPGADFGGGERVYNVIDVRQSYPQKVVKEAIRVLGHGDAAENSIHFAYEMVALTPAAVKRLEAAQGLDFGLSAEDMAKPFVEMSGRRGIGVKADALLATLVAEAERAVAGRQGEGPGLAAADLAARARAIAVGALRYQMARQGRNRVLAFDFDEALAFEGDTGPYLQYSAVRARKIFDKLADKGLAGTLEGDAAAVAEVAVPDDLWDLVVTAARTGEMVAKAVASLEFSLLAGHARDFAQMFHKLYHEHPVLHAEDEATRALRRAVFRLFSRTIDEILESLLGIPVPSEM
ncbi:MAG: arginine--tRNA ligase [Acidobacteria bacterium]|nr:arginine--tRNA ligase [Acidobacteriota bacterium]